MLAAALPVTPLSRLDFRAALDILIIAALIYYLLKLLRGTRAVQMLVAIALLFVFYRGAQWARLEMVEWLLTTMLPVRGHRAHHSVSAGNPQGAFACWAESFHDEFCLEQSERHV